MLCVIGLAPKNRAAGGAVWGTTVGMSVLIENSMTIVGSSVLGGATNVELANIMPLANESIMST